MPAIVELSTIVERRPGRRRTRRRRRRGRRPVAGHRRVDQLERRRAHGHAAAERRRRPRCRAHVVEQRDAARGVRTSPRDEQAAAERAPGRRRSRRWIVTPSTATSAPGADRRAGRACRPAGERERRAPGPSMREVLVDHELAVEHDRARQAGAKTMASPGAAAAIGDRSVPAPLSARARDRVGEARRGGDEKSRHQRRGREHERRPSVAVSCPDGDGTGRFLTCPKGQVLSACSGAPRAAGRSRPARSARRRPAAARARPTHESPRRDRVAEQLAGRRRRWPTAGSTRRGSRASPASARARRTRW